MICYQLIGFLTKEREEEVKRMREQKLAEEAERQRLLAEVEMRNRERVLNEIKEREKEEAAQLRIQHIKLKNRTDLVS